MSGDDGNKRLAIIGVASLFLVAMVIGVTIGVNNADRGPNRGDLLASRKAVENICQPTDYKETCKSTLEKGAPDTDNPNDLVKAAFNAALQEINNVSEHSSLLKELQNNPKTAKAAQDCKELFSHAADDFRRSVVEVGRFDLSNMDEILSNLKVWLSATITYQETCLDGFDNKTSEASEKVRKLLNTSMQMSSNGIAIVSGMASAVGDLQHDGLSSGSKRRLLSSSKNRRLLTWSDEFVVGHYEFVDDDFLEEMSMKNHRKRRLLSSSDYNVGHDDVVPRWMDLDDRRRKLLQAKTIDEVKPNVVVAKDGSGKYKKIAHAFSKIPKDNEEPFVIFVKEGVYKEYLRLEKWHTNVVLIGAGPKKTRITGSLNFIDGTPTFKTCTLAVLGDHFLAKDIGIENTAGPEKHQAVALRVQSDQSIFYNCHFDGYQDTLYTHTYRQYYRDCQISGTIDFIFGDAAAFFQNCTFVVRKPLDNQNCIVTAQGRKERHQPSGIIIHKSNIIADPDYFPIRFKNKAYLGRPWKEYSKTIIMESNIDDLIQPDGWMQWDRDFALDTCYYGEYRNEGPGANMEHRVKWPGIKTILPSRAEMFMPPIFYEGDDWIIASGVPYIPSLISDPLSFAAPPGALDEDPNEPFAIPRGDDDSDKKDKSSKSSNSKYKHKSSSDESSDESKHTSSGESSDKSTSKESSSKSSHDSSSGSSSKSSKETSSGSSDEDSKESSSGSSNSTEESSNGGKASDSTSESSNDSVTDSASKSSEAPSSEPLPSDDLSSISLAPSISEAPNNPSLLSEPSQSSSVPSESPSSTGLETTLVQPNQDEISDEELPAGSPSKSPSFIVNNKRTLIQTSLDEVTKPPSSSPSESPSSLFNLEKMLMQDDPPSNAPSESTSKAIKLKGPPTSAPSESESPVVNLEKMLMQDETPINTPSKDPLLVGALMQEAPTSTPSESPSLAVNPAIMLMQKEPPTRAPSESPSSVTNLERAVLQVVAPTPTTSGNDGPSSVVNLESILMQEESPTSTPSESPSSMVKLDRTVIEDDPQISPPSESPSLMDNLEKMSTQEESPTTTPSESPSSMDNLKRMLMQNDPDKAPPSSAPNGGDDDGNDNDEDVNDDHDQLVTSSTVNTDNILESLHLRTRTDLSLDETVNRARSESSQSPNPAPEATPHSSQSPRSTGMAPEMAITNLERELMESISKKDGAANIPNNNSTNRDAELAQAAQLASSPQSKTLTDSFAQGNQNGTSINGAALNGTALAGAPDASQLLQQLGMNAKPDVGGEKPAQKSGSNGGYEIRFGFNVVAVLIVLFVGVRNV